MKTFYKTAFIILFLGICSCDKTIYYEYAVDNKTTHDIKIVGYDRFDILYPNDGIVKIENGDFLSSAEIIDISPQSEYSVFKARGYHAEPAGIFISAKIDSVNIIFDNQRILTQYCDEFSSLRACEIERNIMGIETEYEKRKIGRSSGEKEYRFTYTITEEDYNDALPIDD